MELFATLLFTLAVPDAAPAAPGDLDPTFGSGGKVITDFGGVDTAFSVALHPDGRLVVAGSSVPVISSSVALVQLIR